MLRMAAWAVNPQLRRRIAGSVARLKRLPKQFRFVPRRRQLDVSYQLHDQIWKQAGLSIKPRVSSPAKLTLWLDHPRGGFR
jgi:hypothetical protein